ncbi:MAG: hypothetical protein AAF909_07475 [Pseudomonadota bacterium]
MGAQAAGESDSGGGARRSRRTLGQPAFVLCALILTACAAEQPQFEGPLEPRDFTLGAARLKMELPEDAAISESPDNAFVWIEIAPDTRSSPNIWLEPFDQDLPFDLSQTQQWRGGGEIIYRMALSEGGSGGAEANLDGRLTLGAQQFTVSCRIQVEDAAEADGGWCLPLLATLRLAP